MAIVMMPSAQNYLVDAPSGFSAYAEMRAGSNGDPYGAPEAVLGTSGSVNAGHYAWDGSDTNGGFDAENIPVTIDINLRTGADSISINNGATEVSFSGPSGQTINYVELNAGTAVNAQVAWSDVQVAFYKSGTLQETASVSGGPAVDTTSSDSPAEEQIATVTPAASNDDEAVITGYISMVCPDFTYPNPEDMFAQTFVFANT
jgi:hypothetical protein